MKKSDLVILSNINSMMLTAIGMLNKGLSEDAKKELQGSESFESLSANISWANEASSKLIKKETGKVPMELEPSDLLTQDFPQDVFVLRQDVHIDVMVPAENESEALDKVSKANLSLVGASWSYPSKVVLSKRPE